MRSKKNILMLIKCIEEEAETEAPRSLRSAYLNGRANGLSTALEDEMRSDPEVFMIVVGVLLFLLVTFFLIKIINA